MATKSQRPNRQDDALSSLNAAIDALNLARSAASITPVKAAFDFTSVLSTDSKADNSDDIPGICGAEGGGITLSLGSAGRRCLGTGRNSVPPFSI